MPRQASDERTSVGRKCLRANVLLPEPLGPIRTTRDKFGIEILMPLPRQSPIHLKYRHLRRRTEILVFRPHRQEPHRVTKPLPNPARPLLKLVPGPLEAVVRMAELP